MPRTPQPPPSDAAKRNPGPGDERRSEDDRRSETERANKAMKKRFYEERPATGAEGIEEARVGNPD